MSASPQPSTRALLVKRAIERCDREGMALNGADDVRGAVVGLGAMAWVPLENVVALSRIIQRERDVDEVRATWRAATIEMLGHRIFQSLISGVRRVFGPNPHQLLAWVHHGWPQGFRGIGNARRIESDEPSETGVCIRQVNFAALGEDGSRVFFTASCGGFEAFADLAGADGSARIKTFDPEGCVVEIRLRWNERAAAS